MAFPPVIGVPEAGGYVFSSGSRELFERHRETLTVPVGTSYVGEDAGFAALHAWTPAACPGTTAASPPPCRHSGSSVSSSSAASPPRRCGG